jgi:hypothetical protein
MNLRLHKTRRSVRAAAEGKRAIVIESDTGISTAEDLSL